MRLLRALRSLFGVLLCLFGLGVVAPTTWYFYFLPKSLLHPQQRTQIGFDWVSSIARWLVWALQLGGARFEFEGIIDGQIPSIVIMNHQSILDIPPLIHIMTTGLPRFVVRARYTRFIPTVSRAIRLIGCITVDPKRDRAAAVLALYNAAKQGLKYPILLYPEGHRSKDGELLPFRPAGLTALLQPRPLHVWTIVHDGMWRLRKLTDTFFALSSVRCRMRVVDCVMSPDDPEDLPAFIEGRRQKMLEELAKLRAEPAS